VENDNLFSSMFFESVNQVPDTILWNCSSKPLHSEVPLILMGFGATPLLVAPVYNGSNDYNKKERTAPS